jgi:predicted ATPase
MLTRLYIDNFRCLVNFELKLGRVNLLLGENGSGKTTVFDVLYRLREFISGRERTGGAFPPHELTRWQTLGIQRFELELKTVQGVFVYSLAVEHDETRRRSRVKKENLTLDNRLLFEFEDGTAKLFHDDFTAGPQYPFDWSQSGIGSLQERPDNSKLTGFRKEIEKFIITTIYPSLIQTESRKEENRLARDSSNLVSWYRFLSQEHQANLFELFNALKQVMPGFHSFSIKEMGEARTLKVLFSDASGKGKTLTYGFDELSDGQKALVALHALLYGLKGEGAYLFLDEPENYVALREIQPWLITLADFCGQEIEQAVVISHHPEVIDYLAPSDGKWFDREPNAPARVSDKPTQTVDDLKTSETIARGWDR